MNIFIRIGEWLETNKKVPMWKFQSFRDEYIRDLECLRRIAKLSDENDERLKVIEAEKQVPSSTAKELILLKSRLDRIELLVGLKREPIAVTLPDSPRIS